MSESFNNIPEIELQAKQLPSRGVPYPESSWVKYRTYTWGEVRKASTSNLGVADTLKEALKGITCSFDKMSLSVADALYLGTARKISTFSGLQIEVPYVCRYCGHTNKGHFNHSDVTFRDLPREVVSFPIEADIAGRVLEFAPMTVKQYFDLHEGRYDRVTNGKIEEVAVQAAWVKNLPYEEAYKLISSLTDVEDFETITEVDKLLMHDMERMKFVCENRTCAQTNSIRLEGRDALLRPFRGREESKRNRIRLSAGTKSTNDNLGLNGVQQGSGNEVQP